MKKNYANPRFCQICQESESHIRQAQNMKVRGGPPTKIWKQVTKFFAWAPYLYIFKGWYKKNAPKQPGKMAIICPIIHQMLFSAFISYMYYLVTVWTKQDICIGHDMFNWNCYKCLLHNMVSTKTENVESEFHNLSRVMLRHN